MTMPSRASNRATSLATRSSALTSGFNVSVTCRVSPVSRFVMKILPGIVSLETASFMNFSESEIETGDADANAPGATTLKGPRYLEMAEGYVTKLALDSNEEIIGYEFVKLGPMMELIGKGTDPKEALDKCTGTYGRFADAVKTIDPRHE